MTNTERKLASIRRVAAVDPIEGADQIEVVTIDGWKVVTKKGEFAAGDLCVYFEIDSLLPLEPEFDFLRQRCYVDERRSVEGAGLRLKTIKLRKQVSQGLVITTETMWEILARNYQDDPNIFNRPMPEGADVTELLGVKKYERPMPADMRGQISGFFPSFIIKTDQARIQNCFGWLKTKWKDFTWEVTTKLDGSSVTFFLKDDVFGVCSRNYQLDEEGGSAFWRVARERQIEEKMREFGTGNWAIQGELMGPGVQGNREKLPALDVYVFDMWDIDKQEYFGALRRRTMASNMGLRHVPVISAARPWDFVPEGVQGLLNLADSTPSLNHPIAEGVVFKSIEDPSVSFKVISNRFLLKEKD